MGLDMFLKILGTFESFAAKIAFMRLQGHMDANVRGDVVALYGGGAAVAPLAGQVQVVSTFAAYMALADVILEGISSDHVKATHERHT
jgi:hypothetical protein